MILRNNRISREFNMAAITARSAKKSVSCHDLFNLSTTDLLFDEKKKKRRPASKSLAFFEAERWHDVRILMCFNLIFALRLLNLHSMPGIFLFRKGPKTNLYPCKNINKYGRRFEDQRCSCLTISVIVFNMASCHLLNMENKRYPGALGTFLMGGNGNFTGYLDASNSVAVNSIESSWLYWCTFL